jgi:RNA polymerase sigma factor for flagellar operon FliA
MDSDDPRADGEALFQTNVDIIERAVAFVCASRRLGADEAEEFGAHVRLKLIDHDYAILRKFQGRSRLSTYLHTVIERLFLDYRISAWGKWRPSAEARRQGDVAILLERLLLRDGHPFSEACEVLRTNFGVKATQAQLDAIATRLPVRGRPRFEPDDALVMIPAPNRTVDDTAADRDRQTAADRVAAILGALMDRLDPQDALILALRFKDGRTVIDIATLMQLDYKKLFRRIGRLLRELRAELESAGIDAAVMREVLEAPEIEIDWPALREIAGPRSVYKGGARE